jgi:hypothetical protein
VDQPAEQVAAPDTIEIDHLGRLPVGHHRRGKRWPLPERAVWPVLVVMSDVGRKDVVEVTAAEDQEPVESFAPNASDPALGVCPRVGFVNSVGAEFQRNLDPVATPRFGRNLA